MASETGVWRVIVIAIVAGGAIIRNGYVRSIEYIIVIVDREGRRRPTGIRSMAHRTIRRNIDRLVIRIYRLVVISCMATYASVWRVVVISLVTGIAIVSNGDVRSGEREKRIVIKSRRRPGSLSVALSAIGRELLGCVISINNLLIISIVAAIASVRCIVIISIVTGGTIIGNGHMRPV